METKVFTITVVVTGDKYNAYEEATEIRDKLIDVCLSLEKKEDTKVKFSVTKIELDDYE
jgi:hypothetical protein